MAATLVQSKSNPALQTTAVTVTLDSAVTPGNTICAITYSENGEACSLPGFTLRQTAITGGDWPTQLWTKVAGTGSGTATATQGGRYLMMHLFEVAGTYDQSVKDTFGSGVGTLTLPSMTPAAGSLIIAGWGTSIHTYWGDTPMDPTSPLVQRHYARFGGRGEAMSAAAAVSTAIAAQCTLPAGNPGYLSSGVAALFIPVPAGKSQVVIV